MESRRITVLGGLILATLTVIAGLVVFAIMQRQAETILSTSLRLSLQSRERLLQSTLENRANGVLTIATRPFLIQQIKRINTDPANPQALFALQRAVNTFLPTGFSGLAILNAKKETVAHAGEFVENPETSVPVKLPVPASLLWKKKLVFSAETAVRSQGETVGYVRAQASLPAIGKMMFDVASLGKTGELAICAPRPESHMQCLPTTLHPETFVPLSRNINGAPLPMSHALAGKAGVLRASDYRNQEVVAAFMPVSDTGLGMVLKIDGAQLFQPVKQQLSYVLPALGALVLLGMLMLRSLVSPLVRKLISSGQELSSSNAQLADRETRLRAIFENVDDGIVVTDDTGAIESVNPGAERIFGYRAEDVVGNNIRMLFPAPDGEDPLSGFNGRDMSASGKAHELTAQHRNGTLFPVEMRTAEMNLDGKRLFIGTLRDITERKLSEERILHLATHDSLTDLPNRNLLQDRVRQAIEQAKRRAGLRVALLFIDLDGFKKVNDSYGHDTGDRLLIEVARRIRDTLRGEDTIARQGGDEFIVALPKLESPEGATAVADKLLEVLAEPHHLDGKQFTVGASIGVAIHPEHGADVETLLKRSDAAMYAAKLAGRGTYRVYTPEMDFPPARS